MWDVLVDASINFKWLPTVTICLYVQINNQRHLLVSSGIETRFTWYLEDSIESLDDKVTRTPQKLNKRYFLLHSTSHRFYKRFSRLD